MVSQRDREILRDDLRARGTKLSVEEREALLKSYLPVSYTHLTLPTTPYV